MRGKDYVPDWVELGLPKEPLTRCTFCGSFSPSLYDDWLEQHYCNDECLEDYFEENPEEILALYKRLNVQSVN